MPNSRKSRLTRGRGDGRGDGGRGDGGERPRPKMKFAWNYTAMGLCVDGQGAAAGQAGQWRALYQLVEVLVQAQAVVGGNGVQVGLRLP